MIVRIVRIGSIPREDGLLLGAAVGAFARAAARAAQSAGSATAASSGDAAPDTSARDAFWQTFAENVMIHLVWPAVWAGVIRVAPKSDRDNPPWTREVMPILNDPEVGSLHWVGGNRMARKRIALSTIVA